MTSDAPASALETGAGARLDEALADARAQVAQLRDEVQRIREERDQLADRLAVGPDPYVAVGAEVENVLRATRELADELHERARRKALDLVVEAAEAASATLAACSKLRTGAEMEASEIVSQAWRQGADLVTKQASWYEELLTAERERKRRQEGGSWRPDPPGSPSERPAPSAELPAAPEPAPCSSRPLTSAHRDG